MRPCFELKGLIRFKFRSHRGNTKFDDQGSAQPPGLHGMESVAGLHLGPSVCPTQEKLPSSSIGCYLPRHSSTGSILALNFESPNRSKRTRRMLSPCWLPSWTLTGTCWSRESWSTTPWRSFIMHATRRGSPRLIYSRRLAACFSSPPSGSLRLYPSWSFLGSEVFGLTFLSPSDRCWHTWHTTPASLFHFEYQTTRLMNF